MTIFGASNPESDVKVVTLYKVSRMGNTISPSATINWLTAYCCKRSVIAVSVGLLTVNCIVLYKLHCKYGVRFRSIKLSQEANDMPKRYNMTMKSKSKQIKILSQNIWCVFFRGGGPERNKRLKILIDNVAKDNPDIICLQEMHLIGLGPLLLCGDYLFVKENLIKLGYIHHSDPKESTPFFGSSSGCVIFSKYPIITSSSNIFKNRRIFRCKGWIYTHISISNNIDFKIVNTHLETFDFDMRFEQMKEITNDIDENVINRHKNDTQSFILCLGDFNVCSNGNYGNK